MWLEHLLSGADLVGSEERELAVAYFFLFKNNKEQLRIEVENSMVKRFSGFNANLRDAGRGMGFL